MLDDDAAITGIISRDKFRCPRGRTVERGIAEFVESPEDSTDQSGCPRMLPLEFSIRATPNS